MQVVSDKFWCQTGKWVAPHHTSGTWPLIGTRVATMVAGWNGGIQYRGVTVWAQQVSQRSTGSKGVLCRSLHIIFNKERSMPVCQVVIHCWTAGVVQSYAPAGPGKHSNKSVAMTGCLVPHYHSLWCTECYNMGGSRTCVPPIVATLATS